MFLPFFGGQGSQIRSSFSTSDFWFEEFSSQDFLGWAFRWWGFLFRLASCRPSMSQVVEEYVSDGSLSRRWNSHPVIHSEQSPRKWLKPQSTPPKKSQILNPQFMKVDGKWWFSGFQKGMIFKIPAVHFRGSSTQHSWYQRFIAWIVQPWLSKILTTKIIP